MLISCFLLNTVFLYIFIIGLKVSSLSQDFLFIYLLWFLKYFLFIYFLIFLLIYFNCSLITLKYCCGFCHTLTWISHGCTCVPHPESPSHHLPHPIPLGCPSALALSPVSCIEFGLVIYFIYGNIHVSKLLSQIIPPSASPTESKSLFFISVSLLLSCTWHCHYQLPKFHIYALIYCIGVFLSDLLHSV